MKNIRMNVLVTGANGQLGKEIRAACQHASDSTFIFTDIDELDIADEKTLSAYFSAGHFDYIVNCAAYTAVDKAESEPGLARDINTVAAGNLAKQACNHGSKLIHISTDFVFDGRKNTPYIETDSCNPLSVYGKTKLEGEKEVQNNMSEYIIIRTSWLYSAFGSNFVKTMIRYGSERGMLKVVYDQTGTPTHAYDLALAILSIISKGDEGFKSGIYHYSNEGVTSWYDFASFIIKQKKIRCVINPVRTSEYPTVAARPAYSVLDKFKIKNVFGIQIPHWQDSLETLLTKNME